MRNVLRASLATLAVAVAVATIGLATPVDATIDRLHAQGFDAIVSRIGDGMPQHCSVAAVRPGQTYLRTDSGAPGAGGDLVTTVLSKTVGVDLGC